jgi:anthranilate/para-aminobenzoate synthase component II
MIFVLDNYDSFTYNLVQAIGKLGVTLRVERNDKITADELLSLKPAGLVLSPGPGRPEDAGNMSAILAAAINVMPILGVCLGHQMIDCISVDMLWPRRNSCTAKRRASFMTGRRSIAACLIHFKADAITR